MKVYLSHSVADRQFAEAIAKALQDTGIETTTPTDLQPGEIIHTAVMAAMLNADVVVAIVTGSRQNVIFELGLALGAGLPVIIGSNSSESLSAALQALPYVSLIGDLESDVAAILRRVMQTHLSTRKVDSGGIASLDALQDSSRRREYVETLDPFRFEQLLEDWFRARGFTVQRQGRGEDCGYDFMIEAPQNGEKRLVEVKKYSAQSLVSVDTVRRLLGVVRTSNVPAGLIVSTSEFTAAARALANSNSIALRTLDELLTLPVDRLLRVGEEYMTEQPSLRDALMSRYRQLAQKEHPDVPDWPIAGGCDVVQARYGNALFVHLKDTMVSGISMSSGMLTLSKGVTGVDRIDRNNRHAVLDRLETHFRPGPRDMLLLFEDVFDSSGRLNVPVQAVDEQLREGMIRHEIVLGLRAMKIFLSHKSADKSKIATYYDTLKLLGFDPWLDKEDMPAGTNVHRGILKGFQDSCAAVFFITPNFKDEAFLATEVDYAISQKTKRGNQFSIITLVFADGDREGTVPALLKEQYIFVRPKDDLDGLREVLRALPIKVGPVRWSV